MICVKSAFLPHLCGKPLPAEFERQIGAVIAYPMAN